MSLRSHPCTGGAEGGRLAVWSTAGYSLLTVAELQAATLDLAWDPFSANKLATVGAGPHLSFWALLEEPSCRPSRLQVTQMPVPQDLLHTQVCVWGGQWKGLKCNQVGLFCRAVSPWNSPLKHMAQQQSSLCPPPLVCVDGTSVLHGAQAHWIPTPPPGKVSVWSSAKKVCLFHWCACTRAAVTALSWAGGFLVTGAAGGALDLWEVRDAPG